MNNSKIKVIIDEENLGKEIHDLVISKVKHLLRNDPELVEKIDSVIDHEVQKKVNLLLGQVDKKYIDDLILKELNIKGLVVEKIVLLQMRSLLKELPWYQELLKEQNEKQIKELFKGEY